MQFTLKALCEMYVTVHSRMTERDDIVSKWDCHCNDEIHLFVYAYA